MGIPGGSAGWRRSETAGPAGLASAWTRVAPTPGTSCWTRAIRQVETVGGDESSGRAAPYLKRGSSRGDARGDRDVSGDAWWSGGLPVRDGRAGGAGQAHAAGPASGVLSRARGWASDLFGLVAEAEWDRSASRGPGPISGPRWPSPTAGSRPGRSRSRSPPGRRRFAVYVPAAPLRNQVPGAVKVAVTVVDRPRALRSATPWTRGSSSSRGPGGTPRPATPGRSAGASRWTGRAGPAQRRARRPQVRPDSRAPATRPGSSSRPPRRPSARSAGGSRGTTRRPAGPTSSRSKTPEQPAVDLTPAKALEYLKALGQADPSGVVYRLPTSEEWTRAARGGKSSSLLVGRRADLSRRGQPARPRAGPARSTPPPRACPRRPRPTFKANPIGLFHTFGNVAEWATVPAGGFARMGGHFRTEPASPLPEVEVEKADELGPDPFVGVRPAFDLSRRGRRRAGPEAARRPTRTSPGSASPSTPTGRRSRLTGTVADSSTRRAADRALEGLWFVAARGEPAGDARGGRQPARHPRAAWPGRSDGCAASTGLRRGPDHGPVARPAAGPRVGVVGQRLSARRRPRRPQARPGRARPGEQADGPGRPLDAGGRWAWPTTRRSRSP